MTFLYNKIKLKKKRKIIHKKKNLLCKFLPQNKKYKKYVLFFVFIHLQTTGEGVQCCALEDFSLPSDGLCSWKASVVQIFHLEHTTQEDVRTLVWNIHVIKLVVFNITLTALVYCTKNVILFSSWVCWAQATHVPTLCFTIDLSTCSSTSLNALTSQFIFWSCILEHFM